MLTRPGNMYKIPLSYTPVDEEALAAVLKKYAGKMHTDIISDFEKEIAAITGSKYVVALNSGTAAIHLGLKALDVQEGDEVIVSTFTYVGSVNPILYLGAKPVFIDSELITWNMDPELLEEAIQDSLQRKKKPKAIVVVHSYGMPAQMDKILKIAKHYEIPVLEDAAEALGARYNGSHLGTLGEVGVLSFNNNKIITTYGGGALLTNNEAIYKKVLHWASQAREDKSYYEFKEIGFSYRIGPINAAVGLAALHFYPQQIEASRAKYDLYKHALGGLKNLTFAIEPEDCFANRWLSTVLIAYEGDKNSVSLAAFLKNEGIETRPLWNPMHRQPVFQDFRYFGNDVSDALFRTGLCLPSSYNLSSEYQIYVTDLVQRHVIN